MTSIIRRLCAAAILSLFFFVSEAQPETVVPGSAPRPYQLLTSGKQLTIKSTKGIKQVMLWTITGNRVVEQREINNNSFVLNIPVNHKTFFLMIGLSNGKVYTEKIGLSD